MEWSIENGTDRMSAVIDMDDPLAAAPPKRDIPPVSPEDKGRGNEAPPSEVKARRGRKPGDAQLKLDLREIETKLTELLTLPSIPMDAAGDEWPARHIERHAPALAHAIAETARGNTQLREKLLGLLRAGDNASLILAILAYAAPVVLYYGILPLPPALPRQFGIPKRDEVRAPSIIDRMREEEERLASAQRADAQAAQNAQSTPAAAGAAAAAGL
jgi:hypothetical protein